MKFHMLTITIITTLIVSCSNPNKNINADTSTNSTTTIDTAKKISAKEYKEWESNPDYKILYKNVDLEIARPFQQKRAVVCVANYFQYLDDNGTLLPFKMYRTSELPGFFQEDRAEVYTKSKKYGFIDLSGKLAVDTIYQAVSGFSNSLAPARRKGFNGYIDKNGKEVLPMDAKYLLSPFTDGIAMITDLKKWGAIDKTGKIVVPLEFSEIEFFNEGYAVAKKDDDAKFGLIDKTGKFVIEPKYEKLGDVHEGFLYFHDDKKDKWGYLNTKGEVVIKPIYQNAGDFQEGLANVQNENYNEGFIDKKGKQIIGFNFDEVSGFSEGLSVAVVKIDIDGTETKRYGYVDKLGNWVFKPVFLEAMNFSEGKGLVLIQSDDQPKWRYITKK
ncbi:MAG: WG repeat-containing protein [Pelobium sp.]